MDSCTSGQTTPLGPGWVLACYIISAAVLAGFGIGALLMSIRHTSQATQNTTAFITARRSQPLWRVAWSFYGSAVGAWAVFLPASYTSFGGWVSIFTYAVASGLPLFLIAEWGAVILGNYPDVHSLNDFAGRRYGKSVKLFVAMLSLLNMSVALISEYTAIGDLFHYYVGGDRLGVIVFVGCVTAMYTAAGGLLVSILTDQGQALLSIALIVVAILYLAVSFRCPLPHHLPHNLSANYAGLSSALSLPISLLSSSIYSEAFWQRVWAAEDPKALRYGGLAGFLITIVVIAFFGFTGFLGLWAGLRPLDSNNNLAFFVPFSTPHSPPAIRVVLVVLAATMNESAVDSLQNAIVATISSNFMVDRPVLWTRLAVFAVNLPIIAIALQGYSLLDIYLICNVITATSTFPLLSGLWLPGVSGSTVLLASGLSFTCTCAFAAIAKRSVPRGLHWLFSSSENHYDYRIFLTALLSSMLGVALGWAFLDRQASWAAGKRAGRLSLYQVIPSLTGGEHPGVLQPLQGAVSPRREGDEQEEEGLEGRRGERSDATSP